MKYKLRYTVEYKWLRAAALQWNMNILSTVKTGKHETGKKGQEKLGFKNG